MHSALAAVDGGEVAAFFSGTRVWVGSAGFFGMAFILLFKREFKCCRP
jgi:hypothetical protein